MQQKIDNIKSSRRNQGKNLFYLFFTVLFIFILVLWVIYHHGDSYKIQNVIQRPSVQINGKDCSKEIQTTRVFVEKFINSYQGVIEKEINPCFKSSFALAKGKKLSTLAMFSTVSETFLGIYPSAQNELIVECSKYPVQMSLFSGLEQKNSNTHLNVPYEEALKAYNDSNVAIDIRVQFTMISGPTFSTDFPKIFSFAKNSLVILNDVKVEIRDQDVKSNRYISSIEPVGLITGEKDFSFAIEIAEKLGRYVAEGHISNLFTTSEFFRKALLDEHLSAIAKEINNRHSKAEKDPAYSYPLWEFKENVSKLKEEAQRYGIDAGYIDDLLKYPTNQPKDGFLLVYYPNHFWFSVQWTIINFFLLLIFLTLIFIERKDYKIAVLINNIWPKRIIYLSLYAVLLSINAWVFNKKPEYMSFIYWIIPGVLLIVCFLVKALKTKMTNS